MPASEDRRSATIPPPSVPCVKPNGRIVLIPYATNIASNVIVVEDGVPELKKSAERAGWRRLEEVADSPEQLSKWLEYLGMEMVSPGVKIQRPAVNDFPRYCRERMAAAQAVRPSPFGHGGLADDPEKTIDDGAKATADKPIDDGAKATADKPKK